MEQTRGVESKATVETQERENKALSQSSDSSNRGEDVEEHKKNKDLQDCWEPTFLTQTPLWGTISHQSEWLRSKSLQIINAGEGVEKREPSYTVGGNAN